MPEYQSRPELYIPETETYDHEDLEGDPFKHYSEFGLDDRKRPEEFENDLNIYLEGMAVPESEFADQYEKYGLTFDELVFFLDRASDFMKIRRSYRGYELSDLEKDEIVHRFLSIGAAVSEARVLLEHGYEDLIEPWLQATGNEITAFNLVIGRVIESIDAAPEDKTNIAKHQSILIAHLLRELLLSEN